MVSFEQLQALSFLQRLVQRRLRHFGPSSAAVLGAERIAGRERTGGGRT